MRIHRVGRYATDIATCCVFAATLALASAIPLDAAEQRAAAATRDNSVAAEARPLAMKIEGHAGATPVVVLAALAAALYRPHGVLQLERRFMEELELSRPMAQCLAVGEKKNPPPGLRHPLKISG
jgi:hypothetical protein